VNFYDDGDDEPWIGTVFSIVGSEEPQQVACEQVEPTSVRLLKYECDVESNSREVPMKLRTVFVSDADLEDYLPEFTKYDLPNVLVGCPDTESVCSEEYTFSDPGEMLDEEIDSYMSDLVRSSRSSSIGSDWDCWSGSDDYIEITQAYVTYSGSGDRKTSSNPNSGHQSNNTGNVNEQEMPPPNPSQNAARQQAGAGDGDDPNGGDDSDYDDMPELISNSDSSSDESDDESAVVPVPESVEASEYVPNNIVVQMSEPVNSPIMSNFDEHTHIVGSIRERLAVIEIAEAANVDPHRCLHAVRWDWRDPITYVVDMNSVHSVEYSLGMIPRLHPTLRVPDEVNIWVERILYETGRIPDRLLKYDEIIYNHRLYESRRFISSHPQSLKCHVVSNKGSDRYINVGVNIYHFIYRMYVVDGLCRSEVVKCLATEYESNPYAQDQIHLLNQEWKYFDREFRSRALLHKVIIML
jgi:hypothetical protein